ncbi:MAG: aldehyde dehydrogenase [Desulfobacterales bacterium]
MTDIESIIADQRSFFASGRTRNISFRQQQLRILRNAIAQNEKRILSALHADLKKSEYEGYLTEVGIIYDEIRHIVKHTPKWARPRRVRTPIYHFPAKSMIYPEPYGVVLVISPWNYPFQLAVSPLIGAISAGNCAVIKPSEYSPHTSELLCEIIAAHFRADYITAVTGDAETSRALLEEKLDYIFFTGSPEIGRRVMESAARHLTPVTLELGGKSPCIVAEDADLDSAAKRIVSGKFINAGQTCIAPDYVLAHHSIKEALIKRMDEVISEFYGKNPQDSPDYPRIINKRHFDRLAGLLKGADIAVGGQTDRDGLYFAPTIVNAEFRDQPLMEEEIFGPILPVLSYDTAERAIDAIGSLPRPLALYLFTRKKNLANRILNEVSFGGGCINDTLIHIATPYLPFGGIGQSGMGRYHGKASFDTFCHEKSILKNLSPFENPFRLPPYGNMLKWLKKVLR